VIIEKVTTDYSKIRF